MNDYKNFCEYTVKPAPDGKIRLTKVLLTALYTVLTAGYIFIFWVILRAWQLLILLPFLMFALYTLTWRFVRVEYEYSIEAGEFKIAKIYDGRSRRTKFAAEIAGMTLIAPLGSCKNQLNAPDITSKLDFSRGTTGVSQDGNLPDDSPENTPDNDDITYLAICPDPQRGKKRAVIFEANAELRRIMRLGNPSAFFAH